MTSSFRHQFPYKWQRCLHFGLSPGEFWMVGESFLAIGCANLIPSPLKAAIGNIFWFQRNEVWSTQYYTEQCSGGDRSLEGHFQNLEIVKFRQEETQLSFIMLAAGFYFIFIVFDFLNAFCLSNLSPVGKAYDCDVDFHSEGKLGADKHNWCYYYSQKCRLKLRTFTLNYHIITHYC